jgi:hypothetical protein
VQPGKPADDWMKSILHARRSIHLIVSKLNATL